MHMAAAKSEKGGRPFVFLNMAMTADGKIAAAGRRFMPFGSRGDIRHLLALRATADAIMSGATTLASGPIALGPGGLRDRRARLERGLKEYPVRIVVSGSASIDPHAEVFKHHFSPIVILVAGRASSEKIFHLQGVADEVKAFGDETIDWAPALAWLKKKWNVNRLLCEGGGELNASLFEAGMVDELHLTICPLVLGGRDCPTISDGAGFSTLAKAQKLILISQKRQAGELFLVYRTNP